MTSNIGSDLVLQAKDITEKLKTEIMGLLHKNFRPEFLNRIESIVFFKSLSHEDVVKIAKIQLEDLQKRLAQRNITLKFSQDAINKLADLGYEKEFGARPLKRAITQYVTVPLSQYLLKKPEATKIEVAVKDGEITLV